MQDLTYILEYRGVFQVINIILLLYYIFYFTPVGMHVAKTTTRRGRQPVQSRGPIQG